MTYRTRHPDMAQEPDLVPRGPVLAFAAMVLGVSTVLVIWTAGTVDSSYRSLRPRGAFPEQWLGPRHPVARVRQDLFDERRPATNAAAHRALATWGWVDRERGLVRLPVEEAMKVVASRRAR